MAAGGGGDPFKRLLLMPDPAKDKRQFDHIRINELRVVLVQSEPSEEMTSLVKKSTDLSPPPQSVDCVLAVGVGTADDPLEYPGMAHLVEHLFGREEKGDPPKTFCANAENTGYYLHSSGYTTEDLTLYQCDVWYDNDTTRKLRNFLGRFSSNDFSDKAIKCEARVISQEYEIKFRGNGLARFSEVAKFFQPACKPLRHFSCGNLGSLMKPLPANVNDPPPIEDAWINESNWNVAELKKAIKAFTDKHYKLKNCVLVLQGNVKLQQLEKLVYAIWDSMTIMYSKDQAGQGGAQNQKPPPQTFASKSGDKRPAQTSLGAPGQAKQAKLEDPKVPEAEAEPDLSPYVNGAAFYKKVYYVQPPEYEDKIFMSWIVDYGGDETKYSRVKPLEYISALLQCCKSGTLVEYLLRKKKFITSIEVRISKTCLKSSIPWSRRYKAQLFTLVLSLTQDGIKEPDTVIAAVLCYIRKLEADEETYTTLSKLRDMKLELFGVARDARESPQHVACAVLYPEKYNKNILTDSCMMYGFDKTEIQRVLDIFKSVDKLNVVIMAHLGTAADAFNPQPAFNAPNQPLEFSYGVKDFSPEQTTKWNAAACQADPDLSSLRMPKTVAGEIEKLQGNPEWEGLMKHMADDTADPTLRNSLGPREKNWVKGGGYRGLYVRQEDFRSQPFSRIEVQLLPPPSSPSPKLRAYVSFFTEMLRIRAQLVMPTWAQAECSIFQVEESALGTVTVNIVGLHHFAIRWLGFLFTALHSPKHATHSMYKVVLESVLKKFLRTMHNPEALCADVTKRGMLRGYAPLIETYQHLLKAVKDIKTVYTETTALFQRMKITAYARTNVTDGFEEAGESLAALPLYNPQPPAGEPVVTDYYKQLKMKTENPPGIHMTSPNRGSHVSSVQLTFQLHGNPPPMVGWGLYLIFLQNFFFNTLISTLRESAGMVYTPAIGIDNTDPSAPCMTITISSDCRWFKCDAIRDHIVATLDQLGSYLKINLDHQKMTKMGYGWSLAIDTVIKIVEAYFVSTSPMYRRYIVQVEGHESLDMSPRMNKGPASLGYPHFIPVPLRQGFTDQDGQTTYLYDDRARTLSGVIETGRDLSQDIPDARF